jgi:hypothetical protein
MLDNKPKTKPKKRLQQLSINTSYVYSTPTGGNQKEKNQSLRMSERDSLIKRAKESEQMSMILFPKK